jgi:hypothetical protein
MARRMPARHGRGRLLVYTFDRTLPATHTDVAKHPSIVRNPDLGSRDVIGNGMPHSKSTGI